MNKNLIIAVLVALLVGGVGGYSIAPKGEKLPDILGGGEGYTSSSLISYASALSKQILWHALNSIVIDQKRIASSTGHGLYASVAWDPIALGTNGASTTVATTTVTVTGAAVGDFAIASFATSTNAANWTISATVSAANTVQVALHQLRNNSSTVETLNLGSATLSVRVFDDANANLQTATTTSF